MKKERVLSSSYPDVLRRLPRRSPADSAVGSSAPPGRPFGATPSFFHFTFEASGVSEREIAVRDAPTAAAAMGPADRISMKVRDIIKLIEVDGWFLVATKGSHRQYKHQTKPGRVTIAGHSNDDLAPGTLNSILKQAKLKEAK